MALSAPRVGRLTAGPVRPKHAVEKQGGRRPHNLSDVGPEIARGMLGPRCSVTRKDNSHIL